MDPITATIVAGVLWFVLGAIGTVIVFWAIIGLGLLASFLFDREWPGVLAIPVAWLAAVAWEIFVLVQVIIHGVELIQLLTA